MRRYSILAGMAALFLLAACSKSNTPKPDNNQSGGDNGKGNEPKLSITDFSPKSAKVGEDVMITGAAFGKDTNSVSVKFGASAAVKPKKLSDTTMTAIVPADAKTGKIQVAVGGLTATSASDFTLTTVSAPTLSVTGFSPKSAGPGATVTITGTGFGTDTNFVFVQFTTLGNLAHPIKPKTVTPAELTVVVPADARSGQIGVSINGTSFLLTSDSFTFVPLQFPLAITSFSPQTAAVSDTIIVKGTFGPDVNDVQVVFSSDYSGNVVNPIKITSKELSVIIPLYVKTGKLRVVNSKQNYQPGFADSQEPLTIAVRSFVGPLSPVSARAGEIIQINASDPNTQPADVNVMFHGSNTIVHPLAPTSANNIILVRVPQDAKTGQIQVSVKGQLPGRSRSVFTVLPPLPPLKSGAWTNRPDLASSGRMGAVAFTINNKSYVGTGTTLAPFDGFGRSDIWQYDPQYNSWMQVADFGGGARVNAVAFAIGNKGYIGTGLNGSQNYTNDFWEYNPDQNTWSQKADFKGSARYGAAAFVAGNNGYVGSGMASNGNNSDFYRYNPATNSWAAIASIPGIRTYAYAFGINGLGYVGGGYINNTAKIADLYMYDPASNTWTAKAAIPNYDYTGGNASCVLGGNAYVGLGYKYQNSNIPQCSNQIFEYIPSSNSWKALPSFAGATRFSAVAFATDEAVFFGLGEGGSVTNVYKDFWAYKP